MSLNSRELDAKVAQLVMGRVREHEIDECEDYFYSYCRICGRDNRDFKLAQSTCDADPRYTSSPLADYEVLKNVRETFNSAALFNFDVELTHVWNTRRKEAEMAKDQGRLSAFVVWYEPGDYSRAALKALGEEI